MKQYLNFMETLVEERYDELIKSLDCCTCEQCRNDIIAFTLNRLPPHYYVTTEGAARSKLEMLQKQHQTDITRFLIEAAHIIAQHPRHNE